MAKQVGSIKVKLDTRELNQLRNGLGPKADKLLDKAANSVKRRWQDYIVQKNVIDTGAYLNSIHIEGQGWLKRLWGGSYSRTIADGVEYGVFQEFGTSRMAARPCATPALEDEREAFEKAWEALLK